MEKSADFGAFGFLYSVYAAANFQATPTSPPRPPIVQYIRRFCQAVCRCFACFNRLSSGDELSSRSWLSDLDYSHEVGANRERPGIKKSPVYPLSSDCY
jgi:hypothetical protein